MLRRNQRGDTIVEVLIAIAVISGIIGAGYAIATKSLNGVRVSQERSEAIRHVETQIETVRRQVDATKNAGGNVNNLMGVPSLPAGPPPVVGYCYNVSGPTPVRQNTTATATTCDRGIYRVVITPQAAVSNQLVFRVEATWDRIGGGSERLAMVYRTTL